MAKKQPVRKPTPMRKPKAARPASTGGKKMSPGDRTHEAYALLSEGISRGDFKARFGFTDDSAFNRELRRIMKRQKVTIGPDRSCGQTGDDMIYRLTDSKSFGVGLPFATAALTVPALADFTSSMLRPDGMSAARFAKAMTEKLDEETKVKIGNLGDRVRFRFFPTNQGLPGLLVSLLEAIASNRLIELSYENVKDFETRIIREAEEAWAEKAGAGPGKARKLVPGPVPNRRAEVHGLYLGRRSLYAILRDVSVRDGSGAWVAAKRRPPPVNLSGVHRDHPGMYIAKVSRIRYAAVLEATFEPIPNFNVQGFLASGWETSVWDEPEQEVVVRVSPRYAASIIDTEWHVTQRRKAVKVRKPDGTEEIAIEFSFTLNGFREIRHWIAWLGEEAEVVSPPELRAEMHRMLSAMASKYGADPDRPLSRPGP